MEGILTIKAIVVLNLNGNRALANYYDEKLQVTAKKFERCLLGKTRNQKSKDDIFVVEDTLVVHRLVSELHVYVVGNRGENPLILDKVLTCSVEVISTLLNRNPDRKDLPGNLDQLIIAFDEICDQGIVLETDPNLVLKRVCLQDGVAEQSLAQVFQNATEMRFPWIRS